jgi:hypothetical protein
VNSSLFEKCADHSMGRVVAGLDLLEASDERSRRAGRELISLVDSALLSASDDSDSHAG